MEDGFFTYTAMVFHAVPVVIGASRIAKIVHWTQETIAPIVVQKWIWRCNVYNDLIRLSELQKFPIRMGHYDTVHGNEHYIFGVETVIEYAENLPKVDAEPVRHGRWIEKDMSWSMLSLWMCSECNFKLNGVTFNYCPDCGAKMDLEE